MSNIDKETASQIYVAFDYPSVHTSEAQFLFEQLEGTGAGAKLGLEITAASGWPPAIQEGHNHSFNVFADPKLKDIGHTVAKAAEIILSQKPEFINIHADSSSVALNGLVNAKNKISPITQVLGVTVLTDKTNGEAIADYRRGRKNQVLHYADKLLDSGVEGVICSPEELKILAKYSRFDRMVKMVPAIRPKWSVPNDQKNFTTPAEAIQRGATHIVVGRPITAQYKLMGGATPLDAFRAIHDEIKGAM